MFMIKRFQHDNLFTVEEESLLVPLQRKKFYNRFLKNICRIGEGDLPKM
jgi:hypothetical protein